MAVQRAPATWILLLAVAACGAPARTLAVTTTEGGYEITRSQTIAPAPHGKVGRKTTDRETRIGNTPETDGNSSNFVMTLGGFVKKCPTADGIVLGDFEYSLTGDAVNTDMGETQRSHYAKRATARINAQLLDDAKIDYLEIDAEFTSDNNGTRTGPVSFRRRFKLGQAGELDMEALEDSALATADLAVAALMSSASEIYYTAQLEWLRENACVEFSFDPPSDERDLGPNQSEQVRATLRAKEDKRAVAMTQWQGGPLGGLGNLAPRKGETKETAPVTLTYTAPANPKEGNGFEVAALSRAGQASGKWRIRPGHDYELHFESTIVSRDPVQAAKSQASGTVKLTGSNKPWRLKPDRKLYRLYDGTGTVSFQTAPLPNRDPCDPLISGSGISELTVVDTYIQITPQQEHNGARISGRADVQMAYGLSMGGGETVNEPYVLNFNCVVRPEGAMPFPFWWSAFLSGREVQGDVNFLKNWDFIGRDGVVARKTLRGNCGGLCDEEVSIFTLKQVEPQGTQQ